MSKKIKALRSISGLYGHLAEGQCTSVSDSLANELSVAGLVQIIEESQEKEADAEKPHKEITVKVKGRTK